MKAELRGGLSVSALAFATALTLWLFLANPQSPRDLGSRLALGLSPDRFGAEMLAGSELADRGAKFFDLEERSDRDAALAQRAILEARERFSRAAGRAASPDEAARARNAWAGADLLLARWALLRGKGTVFWNDDEDLFRWGLAYAREGLSLRGLEAGLRSDLEDVSERLDKELSFWR